MLMAHASMEPGRIPDAVMRRPSSSGTAMALNALRRAELDALDELDEPDALDGGGTTSFRNFPRSFPAPP
tara:strand:- start:84 stop:293 length:210 start_codon:yes stop_codon:yes gene_type:complete